MLRPVWRARPGCAGGAWAVACGQLGVADIAAAFDCAICRPFIGEAADRLGKLVVFAGAAERFLTTPIWGANPRFACFPSLARPRRCAGEFQMFRSLVTRGVSASALTLTLYTTTSLAQQSLPTIDVGASRPRRPVSGSSSPGPSVAGAGAVSTAMQTPAQGYVVTNATTATKTDVPIKETPVSIAVVPRQVITDQADTTLQQAVENVSGVHSLSTDVSAYVFFIRGFQTTNRYRNALLVPGDADAGMSDTANIERIEVVKGPSSILYGRVEPGGLINMVTKQPLDRARYVVNQQIGSYDHYRTEWDFTAPVSNTPGLAYRFTGAYQNQGSWRPFQGGDRVFLAPVISYRPTEWTELTFDAQYLGNKAQSDTGLPFIFAWPAPIPLSRSFQEPNDPRDRSESALISYNFRQNLNEDWKVINRFLYTNGWVWKPNVTAINYNLGTGVLDRITQFQNLKGDAYSTNIDLVGKFTALYGTHNFLMGLDYFNSYRDYVYAEGSGIYPINIFYPIYGTIPQFGYWDAIAGQGFKSLSSLLARQKGFYVQDQVTWFDRLHVLVGARYDVADVVQGRARGPNASPQDAINARLRARDNIDTGWSPRVGVLYDFTPQISGYANYAQSFGANNGLTASGQSLPPERAKQWEIGLKAEAFTGLSATLAFFQITKENIKTRDFASFDPSAVKLAGLQRSRGIELDVLGRLTEKISLVANYAYTDAKVISDSPKDFLNPFGSGLLGNHLNNVPRHSGKIFAVYDFSDGGLGLRVGGGVTAQTHFWGDIQNTFVLPGWARLDGFASYTTVIEGHRLTAQLNLRNMTDARYYESADIWYNYARDPRLNVLPAKPFTATGTIRFEW
jgi:iron complex outermembrane receptor protein